MSSEPVDSVLIQFPDPHFKKKHHKRRVLQPELVETISKFLKSSGGELYIASDVEDVFHHMEEVVNKSSLFLGGSVPESNSFNVATEREIACKKMGRPIYRQSFRTK